MHRLAHFFVTGLCLVMCLTAASGAAPAPAEPFRILVFSRTAGFRHGSIPTGIEAIREIGRENGFDVVATEDSGAFTDEDLARYAAVVFLSTTGDVLDPDEERAFERYVRAGGGYVGVHAASDTEYDWPWYGGLVGAYFKSHPRVQDASVLVTDRRHPSTRHLPERWSRHDEWYNYNESPRGRVHVLASLDEGSYEGGAMGHDHPTAWCHLYDGGRAWYTGGGHTDESFAEPAFRAHLLGGIRWAAGVEPGDAAATVGSHYEKVVLDDDVTDPMELAIASDGRVVFVERGGVVKIWKPETRTTVTAGFVDVFTELEDGLLGVALDPGFDTNGWVYLYYSPAGDEPKNVLSRWTLDGDTLDPSSEIVMLEVATQRDECCHSGGSLAFDRHGNLYLSTGDNTSPFASSGFSPLDERDGRSPFDAQKSAASTADLRGKILRITPQPDGSYTIPPGNLFSEDMISSRAEIYAMGCRNPFRISVDPRTDVLYWGEVGPDAGSPGADRGPAGHDEFNRTAQAGNFGWPYFVGENRAYHDYDFEAERSGPVFDPAAPYNDSPNRSGRPKLPPAQPAWISYTYGPSEKFPELGQGGRCAMAGPVYYLDVPGLDRPKQGERRLPAYYDGAVFIYEWARDWIKAVRFDADGGILAIEPFLDEMEFIRPMDLELGPDGCLYLIEWGTGFGGGNPDSAISRIEYYPNQERPPTAAATADRTSGPLPLTVKFSGAGSTSRASRPDLRFAWDLDGDGSTDALTSAPTFTYRQGGSYIAQLTVTDANDANSVANITITAGNTAPRVAIDWPPDGGIHAFGDEVRFRIAPDDAEDAEFAADRVLVQSYLGHDTHAHPLRQQHRIDGSFVSLRDDGHGADADLFTVLSATYTDLGGPDAPTLSARAEVVLQPRRKQAEYPTSSRGIRLEKADDSEGGGQAVVFTEETGHVSYAPVNLQGVDAMTLRLASGADGARIDLRLGAPDAAPLATVVVSPAEMIELASGLHPIHVEYFEAGGGAGLILRVKEEDAPWRVAEPALFRRGDRSAAGAAPGLDVAYYELLSAARLPDFATLEPFAHGVVDRIDFPSTGDVFADSGRTDQVGAVFTGFLMVPSDRRYSFSLESDDGSRLSIDDQVVVDNDGLHGMVEKSADTRWQDYRVAIEDPGGTHELFLTVRGAEDRRSPVKLNWIEFHGPGVAAVTGANVDAPDFGHGHGHDADVDDAVSLFDGATLDGWRVVGGGATYRVDDGCIIGEVGPGPNTFLRTDRTFRDFELTLEVVLDVPGNSGIQFRSHLREDGRVFGYQCEIDPSERSWSGGIYDEGRRGWLAPLEGNAEAMAAFRRTGWNRYRIRAEGTRLRTWVNDVLCADIEDDADAAGFIALQVHSGERGRIRWRNIRLVEFND